MEKNTSGEGVPSDEEVVKWAEQHPDVAATNPHVAEEVIKAKENLKDKK